MSQALFSLAILCSAFLLFLVQPMITKQMLPHLGGSPAVWQTAMVFFQVFLLLGYAYAHFSHRWLGNTRHIYLHLALLLASVAFLPLALTVDTPLHATQQPILWLLYALCVSIGLPFFLLSANAPMLQHWFAQTPGLAAENPYFLYSVSNFGSFAALLSYPFLIEPWLDITQQSLLWSWIFAVFLVLLTMSALYLLKHMKYGAVRTQGPVQAAETGACVPLTRKLHWVLLAFIPSSLMLGLTNYVTTDIASVPLLWVIPLSLYLLSFVLCFSPRKPGYRLALASQVWVLLLFVLIRGMSLEKLPIFASWHFVTFFMFAMVCHGRLAELKPGSSGLTEYYLWLSLGGALGGIFNALIAPHIFLGVEEYLLIMTIACFLRQEQAMQPTWKSALLDYGIPGALFILFVWPQSFWSASWLQNLPNMGITPLAVRYLGADSEFNQAPRLIAFLLAVILTFWLSRRSPVRLGMSFLVLSVATALVGAPEKQEILHQERNFFGVSRVVEYPERGYRKYNHGTTVHGIQSLKPELRLVPTSYYGALDEVFTTLSEKLAQRPIAMAGLGAGTVLCYGKPRQRVDVYEIDEAVLRIAKNREYFTYFSDCSPDKKVFLGDARLEIEKASDGEYGIIILDAYSSDSLPMHLITREANAIYLRKLAPGGVLAYNISNRKLDLTSVLGRVAAEAGLTAIVKRFRYSKEETKRNLQVDADWVLMARTSEDLGSLAKPGSGWNTLKSDG